MSSSSSSVFDEEDSSPQCRGKLSVDSLRRVQVNTRRLSVMSSDTRTSTSSRRMSAVQSPQTMATQGFSNRKTTRSLSTYVSPYMWKGLQCNKEQVKEEEGPKQKYENTYQVEPKRIFPVGEVSQIIHSTLHNSLAESKYGKLNCAFVSKLLSSRILDQVKSLEIERYKLVCLVSIGSKTRQGMRLASRCLWQNEFDRFASATVENESLFAVGTVYGVYFE